MSQREHFVLIPILNRFIICTGQVISWERQGNSQEDYEGSPAQETQRGAVRTTAAALPRVDADLHDPVGEIPGESDAIGKEYLAVPSSS